MKIKIGEKGVINEGDMKGWYIRVDDDYKNTGEFLIIYNSSPDMSSGVGYDDWVEKEASLGASTFGRSTICEKMESSEKK